MASVKQLLDAFAKANSHWVSYDASARIDIKSSITPSQTWETSERYIPPKDGYIMLYAADVYSLYLAQTGLMSYMTADNINGASGKFIGAVWIPCKKGNAVVYHVAPHTKGDTSVVREAYFVPYLGQS